MSQPVLQEDVRSAPPGQQNPGRQGACAVEAEFDSEQDQVRMRWGPEPARAHGGLQERLLAGGHRWSLCPAGSVLYEFPMAAVTNHCKLLA